MRYATQDRLVEVLALIMIMLGLVLVGCEESGSSDPEPSGFMDEGVTIDYIMLPAKYEDPEGAQLIVFIGGELYAIMADTTIQYQNAAPSCSPHAGDISHIAVGHPADIRGRTVTPDANRRSIQASYIYVRDPSCQHEVTYQYTETVYGTPTPEP